MRIVARNTLTKFIQRLSGRPDRKSVEAALQSWFHEVKRARWQTPAELKRQYASASVVSSDRVVFNIKGNDYRLVASIDFEPQGVWIKWMGAMPSTTRSTSRAFNSAIRPIRTDVDHRRALAEIENLWGARRRTPAGDRLDVLLTLVDAYEDRRFPIDLPDPIEAIRFRLDQRGLDARALIGLLGSRSRVHEVMTGKRPLTLTMIRRLAGELDIPADVLVREPRDRPSSAA